MLQLYKQAVQKNFDWQNYLIYSNRTQHHEIFLLSEGRSRLQNDSTSDRLSNSVVSSIDSIFDACVMFGVFCFDGKTKSGDSVYCINTFYKDSFVENDSVKGMVNISSGMELSLMPGFQVKDSIKLVKFLSLEKYDRVSIFSISKKSIMRGFDFGLDFYISLWYAVFVA